MAKCRHYVVADSGLLGYFDINGKPYCTAIGNPGKRKKYQGAINRVQK